MQFTLELKQLNFIFPPFTLPFLVPAIFRLLHCWARARFHEEMLPLGRLRHSVDERIFIRIYILYTYWTPFRRDSPFERFVRFASVHCRKKLPSISFLIAYRFSLSPPSLVISPPSSSTLGFQCFREKNGSSVRAKRKFFSRKRN